MSVWRGRGRGRGQGACVYNKIGDFSYAQQLQGKQKNVKRKKERKISFEIAL